MSPESDDARPPTPVAASVDVVGAKLAAIRLRVEACGGDPDRITVVAVTKGFGVHAAQAAVDAGICDLGENYAQELLVKAGAVEGDPRWHFLGPIQRNKVSALSRLVSCWHGVDRLTAGEALARCRPRGRVFVQVNATGEATKHGCRPQEVTALVSALQRLDVDVAGLMTIGPPGPPEQARSAFRLVAALARRLSLAELSMGMTDDFEVAVQEGATVLRIGRGLFGPRDRKATPATVGSLNGGN